MSRALAPVAIHLSRRLPWLAAAGLLALLLAGGSGAAPEDEEPAYKTLEADISDTLKGRSEVNKRRSQVQLILKGNTPLAGNEAAFDEYFTKCIFPGWTLTTPESLGTLAKDREQFLTADLGRATQGPHDRLVELTFNSMLAIAQDAEFHPGVRYNAVLVLGSLNARESDRTSKLNPEPLPKALDELVKLYQNPDETDAVQVAALLGIVRHLEWDEFRKQTPRIAADKKAAIVQELLALAGATDPPAGRSREGHTWMRRRALEGLMYVSPAGQPTPEIAKLIEKLVADDAEPVSLRCAAADIMGRLDYKDSTPAAELTARELGHLALVACDAELAKLKDDRLQTQLRNKSQGGYGGGMGGMSGVGGAPGGMNGPPPGMMAPGRGGGMGMGGQNMTDMMQGMMGGKGKGKSKAKTKPKAKSTLPDLGAGGLAGVGGRPAEKKDERVEYLRRRMRAWLYAVQMGLGDEKANPANTTKRSGTGANAKMVSNFTRGVVAYAREPQDKYVKEVIDHVQNVIHVVEAPDLDQEEFTDKLREEMKALEGITRPLKKEEPAEAVQPDDVPGGPAVRPEAAAAGGEAADLAGKEVPAATAGKTAVPTAPAPAPAVPDGTVPGAAGSTSP